MIDLITKSAAFGNKTSETTPVSGEKEVSTLVGGVLEIGSNSWTDDDKFTTQRIQMTPKVTAYLNRDNTLIVSKITVEDITFVYNQQEVETGTPISGMAGDFYVKKDDSWTHIHNWTEASETVSKSSYSFPISPPQQTLWTGTREIKPGESWDLEIARFVQSSGSTPGNATLTIKNTYSYPKNTTPTFEPTCIASSTSASTIRVEAGGDFGYCKNETDTASFEVCTDKAMTKVVYRGSGTSGNATNLSPNTRYYIKFTKSNGCLTATGSCEAVTVTANKLSEPKGLTHESGSVRLTLVNGNGVYKPTTKIEYRECSQNKWSTGPTSAKRAIDTITLTGLKPDTCYEVRAVTTTTAGSYTSNIVSFTTPVQGASFVVLDEMTPSMNQSHQISAKICYHFEADVLPATITPYYRIKHGSDASYKAGEAYTTSDKSGTHCITLSDLKPNQTDYQVYLHIKTSSSEATSEIGEFMTPVLPNPEIRICETLDYLADLLCQAVTALYNGRIKVFSNPYTKSQCDPNSPIPTNLTLWSRALRMFHAMLCLTCDMGYVKLGDSNANQYLAGEAGWTDFVKKITDDEDTEWRLPFSSTVKEYIEEKMHEVWHYHTEVDYLVNTLEDLTDKAFANATKVIVATLNRIYKKSGEEWVIDDSDTPDNFAVYHIKYASETDFGEVVAGSAYYFFEDTWNNLDADIRELDARMKVMEKAGKVLKQNNAEDDMTVLITDELYDYSSLPSGKRVICFVAEAVDKPIPKSYEITYETGDGATQVQKEKIVEGAYPQKPKDPIRTGYDFVRWEDKDAPGEAFNFNQRIYKNYTLKAVWEAHKVTVHYEVGEGVTGEVPADRQAKYGDKVPLPDGNGLKKDGSVFKGWARDGVPVTEEDTLYGDTTLTAIWEWIKITITFHPENDTSDIVKTIDWGTSVPQFEDPTKADHIFLGWFIGDKQYDFEQLLYENTEITARWVKEYYTVTFKPNGGNKQFTQQVRYKETVPPPQTPTWKGDT